MNEVPRISVIIPTRNGAATLPKCLESLRSASIKPHEIIVVDDASNDGSAEIAARFKCRVISLKENIGAARAKNRGAAVATGDILFFTDDDVFISKDALAIMIENFTDPRVAGVVGLQDCSLPFLDFASNYKNLWMRFTYSQLPRTGIGVFYTTVAAIRREVFQQVGGFDESYRGASICEDTEFGQRVWGAGHLLLSDPRVTVTHCKHYTPLTVLLTDFLRARALTLMRFRKWGSKFYTTVPLVYKLAVPTIFAAFGTLLIYVVIGNWLLAALGIAFFITFYFFLFTWLVFLARERGVRFAVFAVLFQPVNAVVVGAGILAAVVDFARGRRY